MSRIKVDALQGTSGSDTAITLSGANATVGGTLAVTGIHTVGTNAVATSDGGAATTSIVQGLAKMWIQFNGTGTIGTQDAFNRGGLTDNGTGNYTVTFTNNMNNNDYASSGIANQATVTSEAVSTSTINALSANHSGTLTDGSIVSVLVHGDLA